MGVVEQGANRYVSKLPTWKVKVVGGKLGIECPNKECKGKALVARTWLRSRPEFIGRSCTYCFKTFQIPEGMRRR